jgi:ABC-type Zn2+ transport system substrate-binding protein/surface adhesin
MLRVILIALLGFAVACDKKPGHDHDHDHEHEHHGHDEDPHDHHEGDDADEPHAHAPKMGGVLVDLDHLVQVEFVIDREAGTLTAYIWDGHVEKGVEIEQETLAVRLDDFDLKLKKVKSELTGARYEVTDERLKTKAELAGKLAELNALDETWKDAEFILK